MAYPDRGLSKAAMGHYLTESARTALEAMEPEESVGQLGSGKQIPAVGPNQLLDTPLFSKTPFLPGSNTLFYTTKVGEKLYQSSPAFDLNDPYCKLMAPRYNSLHDPHLRAYYKRKDNLKRLKKSGFVTDKNKVVCSLKEFNEYRQYLISLKLEFEKHFIKEQKMIEKQVTTIEDSLLLPEAADTSKYRDWLLKEERPTIEEQENVMRNRYLELINEELRKLEQLAEENRHLVMAQDDKKKQGFEKRKQFLLRKKMEEEWKKKEMILMMKIGDDIKREARIEEQRQKNKEEKLKRKQLLLEKKMAYHLKKLQDRFLKEGFTPPGDIFFTQATCEQVQDSTKTASWHERLPEGPKSLLLEQPSREVLAEGFELPKAGSLHQLSSQALQAKGQSGPMPSITTLKHHSSTKTIPSKSKESLEPEPVLYGSDLSRKGSLEAGSVHGSIPHLASSNASYASTKEVTSIGSRTIQPTDSVSGRPESSSSKVIPSTSNECVSIRGAASSCGSAGCGSKTSCGGSAGCGSNTCGGSAGCGSNTCGGSAGCGSNTCGGSAGCGSNTCGGSAGCGSNTCGGSAGCGSNTCGGSAGCGSKSSCCGSLGCGSNTCGGSAGCCSKTSCCGSAGCGSKTCSGSAGCGSKTSCCGSSGCGSNTCSGSAGCGSKNCCSRFAGCCSNKNKPSCSGCAGFSCNSGKSAFCGSGGCRSSNGMANPSSDSSVSSQPGASCGTSKCPFASMAGGNPPYRITTKSSSKTTRSSRKNISNCYGKTTQKKRDMFVNELEGQPKERKSSKKRRTEKSKTDPTTSASQDNQGAGSSYSAYVQYLLSNADQSEIRDCLKGKVSASELNSIIQNVMTWVVSSVTTILYPALTKFEERVKTHAYTVSEESVLSSDNSSSCSTCNEELCEIYGGLPFSSTRKVSFTDTSIKPPTSLSEFQATSGKHTLVLSSNATSLTKGTHTSQDSDHFKRKFKRGKTAILMSPTKYSGLLSTMTSVRSSRSDSHVRHFQRFSIHPPETANTSCHSRHRHMVPAILKTKGALPKADIATESVQMPFGGGEQKPPGDNTDQKGALAFKDLSSIFAELKSYLTQMAAILLEDVFKQILGDLGFTTSSLFITNEVLLESISESLLGNQPADTSPSGSVSRIASFMANDIVENVLDKLQSVSQRTYLDILSKNDFAAGCKTTCLVVSGKNTVPDPTFWRARIPLSFESMYGIAEEIVDIIREKLKVFSTSSQTKLCQFELYAKTKDIGKPLEQFPTPIPPHTVESEAASLIVKETIRKIVSQTVASSETNILQYVEEMISCVLSFIQNQMIHEGSLPTRESSIVLQLINDVFNSLSTEKLKGFYPPVKSRATPEIQGGFPGQETRPTMTTTTLYTADKGMRKPFPPVNVPGMVIDAEVEGKGSTEPDETLSSDTKDQKVSVTTVTQGKTTDENFNLDSRQRSQASAKSAPESGGTFLEQGGKAKPTELEKTENNSDIFAQDALFSSVENEQRIQFPAEGMPSVGQPTKTTSWTLSEALKKMENDFKEEEHPQLLETVQNLLDDIFQNIWAAWPIWPPAPPPPSLAVLNTQRSQQEEQPAAKGHIQFSGQTPISDSDVSNFTGDLVKTLFQKLSCATLDNAESPSSQQSNLIITEILPLKVAADAEKGLPEVHFRDPGMSSEVGTSKEGSQPITEDLAKTMSSLPSKGDLANDMVETVLAKVEAFVTYKVETQFCSYVQNLKASTSSDFSSNIDQDFRKLLETQYGCLPTHIKDTLHYVNNSVLEVKEKAECMPLLPNFDLKMYAQEVARAILQNLKHGLDKEVAKIATPPIIFSESIAASQIINMVFAIFSPQEHQSESQDPTVREDCILEKLLRKDPNYKRDLHTQVQTTVESILNEIYQMIMFNMSTCSPSSCGLEKCRTRGIGELLILKTATDTTQKSSPKSAIAKCDVSVVSDDLIDIVLEDLCPALAVSMTMKGELSDRLQPLVYDLVEKIIERLAQLSDREVKAGLRGLFVDSEKGKHQIPGCSKTKNVLDRKINQSATKQHPDLKEVSPEGVAKSLVDSIFCRLASFAEEKLVSELMQAAQKEKQLRVEERSSAATRSVGLFPQEPSNSHDPTLQGARENKTGSYHQKAKLVVQDLQTNLRLCAEKLTCTVLQFIKKDLEGESLSSQNTLTYKENASAHEMVNKLLTILSVQIALTENEVHKRVLKRIFKRHLLGQKVTFPLLARVEEVLNQITQRTMGELGQLTALNNDSIFLSTESKSSTCHGVMETASQVHAGSVASEIVDSVLHKMYSVVVDTLFSSSESKSEVDSSSSNKDSLLTEDSPLIGASDAKKMVSALSHLQPKLQSLGEELVESVLSKIACFATENLEEILLVSAQQKGKPHWSFLCDMQAGDGAVCKPRMFSEDSESSLTSVSLSKSDLTIYAKDIVSKVLGTIMDEFRTEDYHGSILRINTLSSDQISVVNDLLYSVVQGLHKDDVHLCHFHKHPTSRRFKLCGLPSTEMSFHVESPKAKCNFHDEFKSYLKEVLPKEGILKNIFEQQPLTDASINENLRMLQGVENIVSEVFMRIQDLEPSVCLLKRTPGDLSEKLFCYNFKTGETTGFSHSNVKVEIGSVARDIVGNVFENVQKCLVQRMPCSPEQIVFLERKDQAISKESTRIGKHRFTQPKLPFRSVSPKASMDATDRMAKNTMECVVFTLETFVARRFRRDFKCNFMEIVKFPLESLSFAQGTRSLHSLSTQVGNGTETLGNEMPGTANRRSLSASEPAHNFQDISKLGSTITKECIEAAFREVQMFHSELSVYSNSAVGSVLETIKRTLDKQLSKKEAPLFSSSSESLVLSEAISVMLDRCTESLTEITSELMVENLQLEMSGQAFARDKTAAQNAVAFPEMKKTSTRYRRLDLSDSYPLVNVPGKVIHLEEGEIKDERPSELPYQLQWSEQDIHTMLEGHKSLPCSSSAARTRATRQHGLSKGPNKLKAGFLENDWLPRQRPIPKGSILEKLFSKTEEPKVISRVSGQRNEVGAIHREPLPSSQPLIVPENTCYPAICPQKLTHTANMIVDTMLSEFGLENEPVVRASCVEKFRPLCPLKEKPSIRTSLLLGFEEPKLKKQTVFSRWEKRLTSEKTNMSTEEKLLRAQDGSSLLSKWESTQPLSGSHERHKELALLACAHIPEPCEIQMLADYIVLCVIKELIKLANREPLEEKDSGTSVFPWKQKLRDQLWRSTYPPSSPQISSCLDLLWEPLTEAVIFNIISSISSVRPRQSTQERNGNLESMFHSADSCCLEHGSTCSKSPPLNFEELATRVSKVIVGVLCERNLLQEPPRRKGLSTRKPKYIYVPPLCLADFDDIYHSLVKEVANLLSLEMERRSKYGTDGNHVDFFSHHHSSPPCCSRISQTDDKYPPDAGGTMCLSALGRISNKKQRPSCIASHPDHFIHNFQTEESKDIVNKVLHIIFDSLQPAEAQSRFSGPSPDASPQNMMPYRDAQLLAKRHFFCSSVCPHAYRLTSSIANSNLGLSPKSVLLLDVVSEKLIRALLEKCLTTDKFTRTFDFDEFPEDEQIDDVRKHESDNAVVVHSRGGLKAHQVDSNSPIFTYEIKYSEEPWVEAQSGATSYESALDILAHTLVKPVLTELSLSIEQPRRMNAISRRSVGFRQPTSRKPLVQHVRYGRGDAYSSMPRSRKPESRMPIPGRRFTRKNVRERNKYLLESTLQHRTFGSRAATPTGKLCARKPFVASCIKKSYRREGAPVRSHLDPSQIQSEFSTIYSATFLEDIISQLLVQMYSSLRTKYDSVSCLDMQEMNVLFVNGVVNELKKAGVGLLPKAEQKTNFPPVDSRTMNKLVNSILREFGFHLAADKSIVRDISTMAERAAEIILMEILDYQLPPSVCRRVPKSAYRNIKAGRIIHRIEQCFSFPRAQRQMQSPSPYITVLTQKYLERVINRLVAQFLPASDSTAQKQDKWEMSQDDFDDLCDYIVHEVIRSIAKHKIWVARKDDQCHLHSKKEIQSMVDSVYTKILERSGSQVSIQKDLKCRSTSFVDSITSFIIQEISHHHLQTFLPKGQVPYASPDTEALSKNIVKTVLDSVYQPSIYSAGVFPVKQLEEMVNRVLSKLFQGSGDKMEMDKVSHEVDVGEIAKRLAKSINLQFGKSTVMGPQKGEEQSLVAPLMDVMDDIVDSVCHNLSIRQEQFPCDVLAPPRNDTAFETIESCIEKGISDYLLHPLFSGDFLKDSLSSPVYKDKTENTGEEFGEIQEENENRSPFNTFLFSGFLKDIITGLLSKIFPSTSSRDDAFPQDERHYSDSDIGKLSTQLLDDIRMNLLKHKITVIKDTHSEQPEFSEEDVQNMTDSLSSKILQKVGSLEVIQTDLKNKSNSLIEQVAGFLIGDILKQHVQPFLSQQPSPAGDTAITGDSTNRFDMYRAFIKPLDLSQATQEMRDGSSPSVLREIISGLFSKIAGTLSGTPLTDSGEDLGDTAVRLAKTLARKLTPAQFNSQEVPEEKLGFSPEARMSMDRMSLYKERLGLPCDEYSGHTSPHHTTTLSFEEATRYQQRSGQPSNLAEAECFIQKNLFVSQADSRADPPVPYTTVLSYQILEVIIDRLLCLVFPSSSNTSVGSAQEERPFGPDFYNKIAQIKKNIMAAVLIQAIWISTYGNERETRVSEEAMKSMVESVYRDLLHEVLFQQPLPQDKESLSNFYVTKIACFIMNEMFKYHLQSLAAEEASPHMGYHLTIFPYSLLEIMLSQLLGKIFTAPESTGKQTDFSDANFTEMAANLKNCVIKEISAHEIRLENIPERIPDMDRETEEDIANSIYNQILQKLESQHELQNSLLSQEKAAICRVASVLLREILNYHLCPILTGSVSPKTNCTKWQEKMEPRPYAIHSAAFLEDVIVSFFCQVLSSPNIQAYTKDSNLSENKMRDRVIEQVHDLVLAVQLSNIKVIHCAEECSYFPQVNAEEVIQISNAIYQKLIEKSGSELEIFKAFQKKSYSLAEQLIPLMIKEVSGYHFQPLLSGDTSPYLYSFLQTDAIIERVETILPDSTSSSTDFDQMFLKIIHRIFPLWTSSSSDGPEEPEPTLGRLEKRTSFTKHMKEDPTSKPQQTEDGAGVCSSDLLKDIFRGLISNLLSSPTNPHMPGRKEADPEALLKNLVESIFKEFAKVPVKVFQLPEEGHASPAVSEKIMQIWQHDDEAGELDLGDGQALGKVVDAVCTNILRYSHSETSLYDNLMSQNEEAVDRLACYIVRAVSRSDFEPGSESDDDLPYATTAIKLESDKIIQKFLSDMDLMKRKSEPSDTQVLVVSVLFLEEILSRFVTKILLAQHAVASPGQKQLSKAEVNEIVSQLKMSVEMQMSRNKISLVSEDQSNLHPEYEEMVNHVVHSVFSNVLEKSGSHQELYNDMRNSKVIFPEQVASIIVEEISSYSINNPFDENAENETQSALELDRIVNKVVARMSHRVEPDEELSIDMMMNLPDMAQEPLEDAVLNSEETPINIVPYLGDKPLNVDPNLVSDHLAVLSIKTEPLEKLNKRCRSRTGVSLSEFRKSSMSSKSVFRHADQPNENKKKDRRPSLDFGGHLDVRPREVVCRNSFYSLMKPNITKVELLKDVTSDEDFKLRLLAHDISDQTSDTPDSSREFKGSESEEEEQVLKAEHSFYFQPPTAPLAGHKQEPPKTPVVPNTSSTISRKRSLSLSKCCPPLSLSSSTAEAAIKKRVNSSPRIFHRSRSLASPQGIACLSGLTDQDWTREPEEETLEKAVVGMHLSRDTEQTPAAPEITSVYQDQNINEPLSDEEEEEDQADGGTDSETVIVPRQQSSKFEKLSNALSRVFSRTSASQLNNPSEAQENPTGDEA